MKIAILVSEFPPQKVGGVGISSYNTAYNLSKIGHEVHILTLLEEGQPEKDKNENNLENGFYVHSLSWKKIKIWGIIALWIKILKKIKEINPDIIHVQGLWMGIPGYLAKNILKIPYVVTGHGSDIYLQSKLRINLRSKPVLKSAEAVIALTPHMKKEIQKICNRDVFVIPNGIDLKQFKNLPKKYNEKKEIKILFVGSLIPVKGVKYLIESMKIVRNKYINTNLVIVGDGTDKHELKKLVDELNLHDCVSFIGEVPIHKISYYMAKSDIFVLPSLSEGLPLVILEAMASGLPIIASNVGGIPSLIQNEINGFLVEPKKPDKIAERVIYLLKNEDVMNQFSENNKIVVKKYEWEEVVLNIEDVYLKCIHASSVK